jgi:hypothetical protein
MKNKRVMKKALPLRHKNFKNMIRNTNKRRAGNRVFSFISFLCAHLKYKLKNTGDVEMHISPVSYRSNPQNLQTFTGLNLGKSLLYGTMVLSSLGIATSKVVAQTATAVKPKVVYHAVDSVGIINNKGLKLIVAGNDSTTFNRIAGYIYEPGETKRAVDLLAYDPVRNKISVVKRGGNTGDSVEIKPSPTIEAYLKGQGTNQNGEIVSMAKDANIRIRELFASPASN